uniref:TATA-binding protein interacting (TIP20) domain-containing protein n=1 Tax=Plectus sambesii TaxID=2011161 RepID=A0A914VPW0_9BILA
MAYQIAGLLEKMTSADKDYRFMATNDLMGELQKDSIKLDDDSERKVVKMLLRLLEDKNGEVQNLAVKCLGPLVNKVKEAQVETIVDTLCANMTSDHEQLRDVSSIALKTVISELPAASQPLTLNVTRRVTPKLTAAVGDSSSTDVSVRLEVLDILSDILLRYGGMLAAFHQSIEEVLLPQLASDRLAVRKRAIGALSNLVAVCNNTLFTKTMGFLIDELKANRTLSTTRTYVAAVAAIARSAGHRFSEYLPKVMPLLIAFCRADDDELRESSLQAFESFIYRCPKDMTVFMNDVVSLCADFIAHDPNYNYDEDGDDADAHNGAMETDDGDDDQDDADEYSDDDDMSWKVRRTAAKCLEALIASRRDQLAELYRRVGPLLIGRFKEREENVKSDIFHAYVALLRQTKLMLPAAVARGCEVDECGRPVALNRQRSMSSDQNQVVSLLEQQVPSLVKAVNKQLGEKSLKTRQCCFALLSELLRALPGALSNQLHLLIPGVQAAMSDRLSNSNMKIDTLSFLNSALNSHEPEVIHPLMPTLVPLVTTCVQDSFYKVSAEALTVTQALIRVLRPAQAASCTIDFTPHVMAIYAAVSSKLRTADIDQEVKEKAIAATGLLIATFGDYLSDELGACLPILLDRLRNEMTRLTTVKALTTVVNSPLKINLSPILSDVLPLLAEFLRKNQRALKIATLNLLDALVVKYTHGGLDGEAMGRVMQETPPLVNELDLQISQLALRLVSGVFDRLPKVATSSLNQLLGQLVALTQSPLLQGTTLNAALEMLDNLCRASVPGKPSFEQLLDQLTGPVYSKTALHKQAYLSIAKCAATVAAASGDDEKASELATKLATQLKSADTPDGVRLFSLLTLGELGRRCKHVYEGRSAVQPEKLIVDAFQSTSEELKTAASYSLGGLAVGNLEKFLPFLLKEIDTQPKRQYLLLHALKEVIGSESVDARAIEIFKPRIGDIWKVLMEHASCTEEGTRNVVAECIGKLCLMDPPALLPKLKGYLMSDEPRVRATVVTAVKFMVVDQPQPIDDLLQQCIGEFLQTLTDSDLSVRRVALVAFNSAAHNKPKLVRDLLDILMPSLYAETKVRKELVREVEMGPFKHTVDDGLDLRKAAFECMYTLLETCLERLDVFEFMTHVEDGLKDHHDIKLLTYLMVGRLSALCPAQVLQRMDKLVEPLKSTCNAKVKANAVKQEYEKLEELKRSALRAVLSLQ